VIAVVRVRMSAHGETGSMQRASVRGRQWLYGRVAESGPPTPLPTRCCLSAAHHQKVSFRAL